MPHTEHVVPELLGEEPLTLSQIAHVCCIEEAWVVQRVSSGVLLPDACDAQSTPPSAWRFSARMLARARRIAELERTFNADPELAALTADLMEEVRRLRRALQQMSA
ncbi:hypothetical protein AAV94_10040 [Lampropedia cohaerens]|uniref:MerR family transcriptional regulator n=1 Tax=Lampropedia cohaerens TaxID=1610491 RepID=A0A0U1PYF8_9BURK|nr:chaperone modulator CbpM [Lampropedia cohaerens]KKW67497.1 hypothetical protein AAV94_10040 [Lampropedia cohaerens]